MKVENKELNFIKFESINLNRADDIAIRFSKKEYKVTRAEVIVTNRCQLNCHYCQKHYGENDYEERIDPQVMIKTLDEWLNHGCKFIHFTGGEATLCEDLPFYVKRCRDNGAEVTLSTNATSDIAIYEKLIRSGVSCFHISLDTCNAEIFDKQVGVANSFEKVLKTIQLITEMRDKFNYKTKLVINTCITPASFLDLINIVKFMLSLKPNDLKLIPISQLKDQWESFSDVYEEDIKPALLEMVPDGEGFTMLRNRINNLVKPSFRGYNDKKQFPPCYLSADERTIDPEGRYYGCYINYREGANPVGNIQNDSFLVQSEKLRLNMLHFTQSDICQKYCADITVMCNKYIDNKVCLYMDCKKE